MKKILYSLLLFPVLALGQSSDQNYVKTTTYRAAGGGNPQTNVTYFDGLGRPIEQIAGKQSSTGTDWITHIEYDAFGRQAKEYLSYSDDADHLLFRNSTAAEVENFYGGDVAYSQKFYEASPLNRVQKQAAPGAAWMGSETDDNDRTVKILYGTNVDTEVQLYNVATFWYGPEGLYGEPLSLAGYYPAGTLYKTITKDENWREGKDHTIEEFKDKEGKMLLKRTYESNVAHDTYYVYNRFGELTHVIPPMGNSSTLAELCYMYNYDNKGRLAFKKLPGVHWQLFLYDKQNRQVGTGPVMSPYSTGELGWMVTQYDAFGRVIATGWKKDDVNVTTRKNYQDQLNNGDNPLILTEEEVLSRSYYDHYNFTDSPTDFAATATADIYYNNSNHKPKGLPTGSWARVIDGETSIGGETTAVLYDYKSRPARNYKSNYLKGYTQTDTQYDFIGKVMGTIMQHKRSGDEAVTVVKESFEYTPEDRLLRHYHQVNDQPQELLAANNYNERGELNQKYVGGTTDDYLQKVDYSYNIRGWLTTINPRERTPTLPYDLFYFRINYEAPDYNPSGPVVQEQYNGNISETLWKTDSDNKWRKYSYDYDALNRLKTANYQNPETGPLTNSYNESLKYDVNGNITSLKRNGELESGVDVIEIDDLQYEYVPNTNILVKVTDHTNHPMGFKDGPDPTSDDFAYDSFGNLTLDRNKGIEKIIYNHLNLPVFIHFSGGNQKIQYIYNGLGQKLAKKVFDSETETLTDYLDGFQYKDKELQFFPTAEGYVNHTKGKYNYIYNYTDHLGNVRVSYTKDPADGLTKIIEENNYYPFGLKHTGYNANVKAYVYQDDMVSLKDIAGNNPHKYKYNGKELQDELGLNLYDYGARNYDPAIGRWMNMDPLAEQYRKWSPYNYCVDNPIRFIDPDGMGVDDFTILIAKDGAGGRGHMAAVIEDGKGNYYYTTMGGAENGAGISKMATTGIQGGMNMVKLEGAKSMTEAIGLAKTDTNNSTYTDQVTFKTDSNTDKAIFAATTKKADAVNSGTDKYNLLTNNCTDAVERPIEDATSVKLPDTATPNTNFTELKTNKNSIQNNITSNENKIKNVKVKDERSLAKTEKDNIK